MAKGKRITVGRNTFGLYRWWICTDLVFAQSARTYRRQYDAVRAASIFARKFAVPPEVEVREDTDGKG
jgi:hypothetical protein